MTATPAQSRSARVDDDVLASRATTFSQSSSRPTMRVQTGPIASMSLPSSSRRRRPPLHRFRHRDALREREAHRGVDADAAVRGLLDGADARASRRDLHDHVGRKAAEAHGLLDDGAGVAVQPGVGLDGQAAVSSACSVKRWLEEPAQPSPTSPRPASSRSGPRSLPDAPGAGPRCEASNRDLLLEDTQHDDRVARGSDRAVFDRVVELVNVRRVVPQTGRSGLGHLVERALVRDGWASDGQLVRHITPRRGSLTTW